MARIAERDWVLGVYGGHQRLIAWDEGIVRFENTVGDVDLILNDTPKSPHTASDGIGGLSMGPAMGSG